MEALLPLVVGWLLGILQPIATEPLTNWKRRRAIRVALDRELRELRYRMTLAAYQFEMRYGVFDRAFIEWAQPVIASYENSNPRAERISNTVTKLLSCSDGEIAFAAKTKSEDARGLFIPHIDAPYLEHIIEEVQLFPPKQQEAILGIRAQIQMLNEIGERVRQYELMTFDSGLTPENRASLLSNSSVVGKMTATGAREVADKIGAYLDLK